MIYNCYWNGCGSAVRPAYINEDTIKNNPNLAVWRGLKHGKMYDAGAWMAELITSNDEDSFVFIVTNEQKPSFDKWVEKYALEELIFFQDKKAWVNENYPGSEPRLWMTIFCGKNHIMRSKSDE